MNAALAVKDDVLEHVFDEKITNDIRDMLEPELEAVDDEEEEDIEELKEAARALLDILKVVHVGTSSNLEPLH